MKKVKLFLIAFLIIISVSTFAKNVKIKTENIARVETISVKNVNGVSTSKYYIVMKNNKRYELHTAAQLKAVTVLYFSTEYLIVKVK